MPYDASQTVIISTLVALATQGIAPTLRFIGRNRLTARKLQLEEVAERQNELDASYVRLERENVRLEDTISVLRKELDTARRELAAVQERCDHCERLMRLMGRRDDFPGDSPKSK